MAHRIFSPFGGFIAGFAESCSRAHRANAVFSQPDGFFEKQGTTRQKAIRKILDV